MTYGTMLLNPCSSAALQIPCSAWSNPLRSVHLASSQHFSHIESSISNKTHQVCRCSLTIRLLSPNSISSDLWEKLCFKSYPLLAKQLIQNVDEQPESWRDQYFVCPRPFYFKDAVSHIPPKLLREAEAHRLEEVKLRLRNQRIEEAERKKEREVKLTDKLPPAKRARATCKPYLILVLPH